MKPTTFETIVFIAFGAVAFILFAFLILKALSNARRNKDEMDRKIDQTFERYISKKT